MATNNNDRQEQLNKAMATLKAGGEVYLSKTSRARLIDGKIVTWNPQVISAASLQGGNATITKEKLAAAYKAGKIGYITQAQLAAALNPTPSVPKPKGNAQPKKKIKGKADDDSNKKKPVASPKVRTDADPELSPGKRLKNPLGALSSYNYQLSLYMVTPDALELFKEKGYRDINSLGVMYAGANSPDVDNDAVSAGAYIVAQSGGVNLSSESRSPSFNFDYGIDNLTFEIVGPKENGAASAEYTFQFQIIEPYGFSFISNLKRANDAVADYNKRLIKKRAAIAKKKAAAQQQRTRNRKGTSKNRRPNNTGRYPAGTETVASYIARNRATQQGNYYNTRFQSNNDILAGVRGTKPGSKPSQSAAAIKAANQKNYPDAGFQQSFIAGANARKAAAKKSAGKPTGKGSNSASPQSTPENPTKQLFVLGIRFYGYNASGQPVRGTDTTTATSLWGSPIENSRQQIDPGNDSYALFERFYPIQITSMKTVVDGGPVKYQVTAQPNGIQAMGTKRGMVNTEWQITASTVGEALDKLMENLNKEQQKLNNDTGVCYTYDIKYASEYDAERIRSAKIVSQADLDKYKWPGSGAKKTKESNASTETTKNSKPKNTARTIKIKKAPIIQNINEIIAQSSFLQDAMKTVFTTALEPDQDKEGLPELDQPGNKTIEWFHLTPEIENLSWNDKTADWVYDINYVLNVYDTPVLDTAYTNPGKKYYGPVKRYEYWYTGTNTEVLRYKQELNNAYYNVYLLGDEKDKKANENGGQNTKNASGGSGNSNASVTPTVQNQKTGQSSLGKAGLGMEAQNGYLTSLFDPNAVTMAEVEILGDPDWLMSTARTGFGENESTVYNKFYGRDPYSISPAGGQVFFEIDFREAVDYKSNGQNIETNSGGGVSGAPGTMSINSSILFWKDSKSISKLVKGISYSLNRCKHIFSGGTFKQILYGNINTFGDSGSNDDGKARENNGSRNGSGPNRGNSKSTTANKGWKNADYEAAKRYSNNPKVREQAWNKELARRNGVTDKTWQDSLRKNPAAAPPPKIARNRPET